MEPELLQRNASIPTRTWKCAFPEKQSKALLAAGRGTAAVVTGRFLLARWLLAAAGFMVRRRRGGAQNIPLERGSELERPQGPPVIETLYKLNPSSNPTRASTEMSDQPQHLRVNNKKVKKLGLSCSKLRAKLS